MTSTHPRASLRLPMGRPGHRTKESRDSVKGRSPSPEMTAAISSVVALDMPIVLGRWDITGGCFKFGLHISRTDAGTLIDQPASGYGVLDYPISADLPGRSGEHPFHLIAIDGPLVVDLARERRPRPPIPAGSWDISTPQLHFASDAQLLPEDQLTHGRPDPCESLADRPDQADEAQPRSTHPKRLGMLEGPNAGCWARYSTVHCSGLEATVTSTALTWPYATEP